MGHDAAGVADKVLNTIQIETISMKYANYDIHTVYYVEFSPSVASLVIGKWPNPIELMNYIY